MLDRLVASGRVTPLIAVFVDPVSRADEYTRRRNAFAEAANTAASSQFLVGNAVCSGPGRV